MSRRVFPVIFGSLFLAIGWGCADDPTGPPVEPFCASHSRLAIVTFDDANLEAAIKSALSVAAEVDLTCGMLETLTTLPAGSAGIANLAGIENLTSLTSAR